MTSKLWKMLFAGVWTNIQSFTTGGHITMARILQSFTDAMADGEECWETLCDLDEADVDSVVEDIGVHCLVNGETAGCKDQCTGGSGATEEAGGKRRRLTGKTVLQTSIAELSARVNWNDIICESLETLIHDEHLICTPRGKRSIEIASQVVDSKSSHAFECFCGDVGAKLLNCMSKQHLDVDFRELLDGNYGGTFMTFKQASATFFFHSFLPC